MAVTHLTDRYATKAAVTDAMRGSEYVHLATHGAPDAVFLAAPSETAGLSAVECEAAATLRMAEVQQELRRGRERGRGRARAAVRACLPPELCRQVVRALGGLPDLQAKRRPRRLKCYT